MNSPAARSPLVSVSDDRRENFRRLVRGFVAAQLILLASVVPLWAQILPKITLSIADPQRPQDIAVSLQILFLITILALAPSILVMMTSFVRIIVVFSFLRRALGTQTMPPDQILVGLALFMTVFIMMPTLTKINDTALQPYLAEKMPFQDALKKAETPIRDFMLRQVAEKDIALFVRIAKRPLPHTVNDLSLDVIIPAFITSELRTAFIIGFVLYIPFLVIDMIVASVLLSMGMMMLPPVMVSMPLKIILFVLVDGWDLIVQQLVISFR